MISNRLTNIIAALLLSLMFLASFFSMIGDSLTFDEKAHIGAGFSYLVRQDYRLNPEHPPLIKDIAALPLTFLNLHFPDNDPSWLQKDQAPPWWVQFDFGKQLLYYSGNNPAQIIFWTRLMMIFVLILLGWLLFWWIKKMAGRGPALLSLTLFAFSPTFLAHGRLVTTDVGAALGALVAIIFWLRFLQNPSWKNVVFAGLAFGTAQLFKFTLLLLIPFFLIITIIYAFLFVKKVVGRGKNISSYLGKALLAGLIGFLFVIWPFYQLHVLNYPLEQQVRDTAANINQNPIPFAKEITIWMAGQDFLRAPAQYLRGVLMAFQRSEWGNTTYFLGQISAESWWYYFPIIYLSKIPLAFHFLTLFAILTFLVIFLKRKTKLNEGNFWIFAIFLWVLIYWIIAIRSNLNIGIRHLIPLLPFTYILVVLGIYQGFQLISKKIFQKGFLFLIAFFFGWYISSSLLVFPHYLSYYNELAPTLERGNVPQITYPEDEPPRLVWGLSGGTKEGYKIAVDSNYDWGQDFYRLIKFVKENRVEKIYLDYFGGEESEYWLKDRYVKFDPKQTERPKGWLAVSSNQLMGGIAEAKEGFDQETGYYNWLKEKKPSARAGFSIFIYYIPD